ncbi:MAG: lipid-A-disaccharide synthase, partial [Nitrospinota bacterium]|nr:lipid-A-disaccharide synthase [Nitrospinota bacterium]
MKYFISAAEESGEIYGARIVKELKAIDTDAEFEGVGGDRMKAAGVKLLYHSKDLAAIGLIDILKKIFFFKKVLGEIGNRLKSHRYDAVIIIDAPELNFRIGKMAHKAGIPVFYYVCPQLWAWRSYRVNSVKKWVDTML